MKLTIAGDKLRYETGLASKSMRIIQLPKVQDVRVLQSFWQRIFGVGDISIETAGENSRLVVRKSGSAARISRANHRCFDAFRLHRTCIKSL